MTFPNILTFIRLGLTPVGIAMLLLPHPLYGFATVVFVIAALTDWFDGYLARRWKQVTHIGTLLDSIADKILVYGYFACLQSFGVYPMWLFLSMLARDLLNDGFRSFAAGRGSVIGANRWGKWKATLQMASIILGLLFLVSGVVQFIVAAQVVMIIALALGIIGTTAFIGNNTRLLR